METDHELRVIHALRLKAFLDTAELAQVARLDHVDAEQRLGTMVDSDMVKFVDGQRPGWRLLPAGRARGEQLLADEVDAAGVRDALRAIYNRFLDYNQPFLRVCTDWQVREVDGSQVMNDHTEPHYDEQVIGRLGELHTSMTPILADLEATLARFGHYPPRFAAALEQVQAGEVEWFTKPIIESYHTVWFELHEDLLASLGIDRAKEGHA